MDIPPSSTGPESICVTKKHQITAQYHSCDSVQERNSRNTPCDYEQAQPRAQGGKTLNIFSRISLHFFSVSHVYNYNIFNYDSWQLRNVNHN